VTTPRSVSELTLIDADTVALVRESCQWLPSDPGALTRRFYELLFDLAPQVRPMFPEDLSEQSDRLLQALLAAVAALDHPVDAERQLRRLGAAHRTRYGVTEEMYVYVGHALIRAVREVTGTTSVSVSSAWAAVYEWLAAHMIDGARQLERGPEIRETSRDARSPGPGPVPSVASR
jgi:hemoglobin-like flavoprotein